MAAVSSSEITDKKTWEDFLETYPDANFLQSWNWGEFHAALGHEITRSGLYRGGKLVGVMLSVVEPARRGRHLTVPAGPLIDWSDDESVAAVIQEMRRVAKGRNCVFVRVRPQLPDNEQSKSLFKKLGFIVAPMHLHLKLTTQIDVTKTDEELKRAMRKGTKYEVNRSQRMDIKIETATDMRFADEFYDLQMATAERQKFVPFSKKFLTEQFRVFAADGQAVMYRSSTSDGKLLAMAFVIYYHGVATYHYGASTDLARTIPGAYALQWRIIHDARERGCKLYDMWGITPHGATKHRFYGVSVFKRGFGGDDVAYLPARDLVIQKAKYALTYSFETVRRKARHL